MDDVEIPFEWRKCVCEILRSQDTWRISVVQRAMNEWYAAFPDAFPFELYNALAMALEVDGVKGKRVTGMFPAGEVWAFWFAFRGQRL